MLSFFCGKARAFMVLSKMRLYRLHGKLNIASKFITRFFAATLCDLVQQRFECVGLAACCQHLNNLRSCAVEPLLAHWIACLKQLE
jgi:hypothetical protein